MTLTGTEIKMIEIPLNDYISMAQNLAADWEKSVKAINKSSKKQYKEPLRTDLSPELRAHLRVTSAMNVLSQYYTPIP